jgi:hypothetical protein
LHLQCPLRLALRAFRLSAPHAKQQDTQQDAPEQNKQYERQSMGPLLKVSAHRQFRTFTGY